MKIFTAFFVLILICTFSFAQRFSIEQSKLQKLKILTVPEQSDPAFSKISSETPTAIDNPVALDSFIVAKMQQYHFPGLQACIIKDDQIIWKGAFGYANIAENKLVTDSTLFSIASVSKPMRLKIRLNR